MQLNISGRSAFSSVGAGLKANYSSKTKETNKSEEAVAAEKDKTRETVEALAKRDASEGIYMSKDFSQFLRDEIAKVGPDREAAVARATMMMNMNMGLGTTKGKDLKEQWLDKMFQTPGARLKHSESLISDDAATSKTFQTDDMRVEVSESPIFGRFAMIYDENGEAIVGMNPEGWNVAPTKAEIRRGDEVEFMYIDAYQKARAEMAANGPEALLDIKA